MSDLFNLNPETMVELQKELYKWQVWNFGEQDDRRMVLGICEESGELCHAHLKIEQGIRGSKEDLLAKMRDAIGDISIYALNLLSNHEEQVPGLSARKDVEETSSMERIGDSVLGIFCTAAKIETARKTAQTNPPHPHPVAPHEVPPIARHVQQLFMHLNMLCGLLGWNLEKIIRETWSTVGKRNWKANPQTGGAAPQPKPEPKKPEPRQRRRRRRKAAKPAPAVAAAPAPAESSGVAPAPEISALTDESDDVDDYEDDDGYEDDGSEEGFDDDETSEDDVDEESDE